MTSAVALVRRRWQGVPKLAFECRHCGYAVPKDLVRCPGCSRSYRRPGRPAPTTNEWDLLGLWPTPPPRPEKGPKRYMRVERADTSPPAYRSLLGLALPLRFLLAVTGWGAVGIAGLRAIRLVVTAVAEPWPVDRPETLWQNTATWSRALAGAEVFAIAVTGLVFMAWAYRAYENLPALGIHDRRYWTAWAVLGWVLPGVNLFVPKLLIDDVWRASSPSLPARVPANWQRRPVGDVVHRWWVLWLVTPALAVVVTTLVARDPSELGQTRLWEGAALLAGLALAGAAKAGRQVVGIITVAQAHRADLVGATPAPLQQPSLRSQLA